MIQTLVEYPLLLLFVVITSGYLLGNIRMWGSKLGVTMVLFVGLGIGALDPQLQIPEIILFLGLAIFVYSIGLSSGPGFFAIFQRKQSVNFLFISIMLVLPVLATLGLHFLFGFNAATSTSVYAGSSTSTATLAGILDLIGNKGSTSDALLEDAVTGFSLTYPLGILGVIIAFLFMKKALRVNLEKETQVLRKKYPIDQELKGLALLIKNENVAGKSLRDILNTHNLKLVFGRLKRGEDTFLTHWDTTLQVGDILRIAGTEEDVSQAIDMLGEEYTPGLPTEPTAYELRRIFISNPEVAGKSLAALNLSERFSAIVTRIRRGDSDLLASGDTILELGDHVRFIARKKDIPGLTRLFGDSYHALSQIDLFSFGLGMSLGILLGLISFELPGSDVQFQLGFAGGPLVIALALGALRRTGPIVWTLPYGANHTLRQIGLIFLLAAIGVRSGHAFFGTLLDDDTLYILLSGAILTFAVVSVLIWIGYKMFKIPFLFLMGMLSNQPAILDFSIQQSGNQLPGISYGIVFPLALIAKIILGQILYVVLG